MALRVIGERMEYLLINDTATICFRYKKREEIVYLVYILQKKSNPDNKEIKVKGKASKLIQG